MATVTTTQPPTRWDGVARDLKHAIAATEARVMAEWLLDAATYTGKAGVRRIVNVGSLLKRVGVRAGAESKELAEAYGNGRFMESLIHQSARAGSDISQVAESVSAKGKALIAMAADPNRIPEAVVLVAAALVTSGGVDANGGVPDLDLTLGIDAHRSIFTHSIIAGTAVEGCLYAVCTLVGHVYKNLPAQHDALFDLIECNRTRYLEIASAGASAGIAYHLAVDATLQPAAYHDMPFSMPMESHQTMLAANAVAEATDSNKKSFDARARADGPYVTVERTPARSTGQPASDQPASSHTRPSSSLPSAQHAAREVTAHSSRFGQPETVVPTKTLSGGHRSLWFGWLLDDMETRRPVIVVPSAGAYAHGHVEVFYGDDRRFVSSPIEDVVPRLSCMSESEHQLRRSLARLYKAARSGPQ